MKVKAIMRYVLMRLKERKPHGMQPKKPMDNPFHYESIDNIYK